MAHCHLNVYSFLIINKIRINFKLKMSNYMVLTSDYIEVARN